MKLRICTVDFKKAIKVQIGGAIKTRGMAKDSKANSIIVLELGIIESFGKPHFCGIFSKDIVNIKKIKNEIEEIEKMSTDGRVEWFSDNFPKARIIKIDSSKVSDQLKDTKKKLDPAVVISNAVELKWSK